MKEIYLREVDLMNSLMVFSKVKRVGDIAYVSKADHDAEIDDLEIANDDLILKNVSKQAEIDCYKKALTYIANECVRCESGADTIAQVALDEQEKE